MKRILFTALAISLFTIEPSFAQYDGAPFDASQYSEDSQVIAFVGRKNFIREDENYPPTHDNEAEDIIIYMDGRYEARYEILNLISGVYNAPTLDFHAYDHYGMPRFSKFETVLIFVNDGPGGKVHSKYNFYVVHRTTDGDWAACGDAHVQYDSEEKDEFKEPLESISFLEPVRVNVPSLKGKVSDYLDEDEIISDAERVELQTELDADYKEDNRFYQPPIWRRDGDIATCQLGTRVKDLFEFQNQTRFLPEKREEICRVRHAHELEALGNNHEAKRTLRNECEALLKIQNLP